MFPIFVLVVWCVLSRFYSIVTWEAESKESHTHRFHHQMLCRWAGNHNFNPSLPCGSRQLFRPSLLPPRVCSKKTVESGARSRYEMWTLWYWIWKSSVLTSRPNFACRILNATRCHRHYPGGLNVTHHTIKRKGQINHLWKQETVFGSSPVFHQLNLAKISWSNMPWVVLAFHWSKRRTPKEKLTVTAKTWPGTNS